jgi:putative RecB family exonuclease
VNGLPETISVSQITLYLTCSLKYQFQYIDRLPRLTKSANMVFGGAVHAALEWLFKERKRGRKPPLDEVLRVFESDWYAQASSETIVGIGDEPEEKLLLKGKELLALYYHEASAIEVRESELHFQLPLVNPETGEVLTVPLRGVIDLVQADGTVTEFKNAKKGLAIETLPDNLQLTAYHYAYQTLFGTPPKDMTLVQFVRTKSPKIETHITGREPQDVARFFHIAQAVRRGIEASVFVPNRGCWMCFDCEYQADCLEWAGSAA